MYNKELYITTEGPHLQDYLEEGYEIVTQYEESISNTAHCDLSGTFMGNQIQLNGYMPIEVTKTKFLLKLTKEAQILYAPPPKPDAKEILSFGDTNENK